MIWFNLALALIKVTGAVLDHMERNRLIDQGRKEQLFKAREQMDEALLRAALARDNVSHDPDSVRDDPDNRDNRN